MKAACCPRATASHPTMDAWILDAKLHPPAPPPGHLARDVAARLGAWPPVVLLEGGPGTGKTVALRDMAARRAADGALTVWYAPDELDAEPATAFHYLVAGLRRHVPDAGEDALALLRAEKADARLLWQALFRAVAAYNLPGLTIALDDAHHLAGVAGVLEGLAYMAPSLPPSVRVLVATRRQLPALAKLRARGLAAALGPAELAFTPAEAAAYLAGRARALTLPAPDGRGGAERAYGPLDVNEPPPAWLARAAEMEGWPLGLALVAAGHAAEARGPLDENVLDAYVAEEVYAQQPPERQAFLLRAALLPAVTPPAYAAAFGGQDAPGHLAALEAAHLATRAADGATWRFPAWLAAFLAREAVRATPPAELAGWHAAVGALARAEGRAEAAVRHFLAAGDVAAALAEAEAAFPAMRHDGRHAALERLLAAFPAELRQREPALRLWAGHVRSRAGDREGAAAAYERARDLYQAAGDPAGELAALVRLATFAARSRDLPAFGRLALAALRLTPTGRPADVADLHLARALAADVRGDHALMRACNEEVLAVPPDDDVEVAASHVIARLNLFTAATQADDHAGAAAHAEAARALAAANGLTPYAIYAGFLLAHTRLAAGDARAAAEAVAAIPAWWPDLLDWHMAGVAHTVLGALHGARGAWAEAERELAAGLARFDAAGYAEGRKLPLAERAAQAVRRGRPDEALRIAAAELPADPDGWNAYDWAIALEAARAHLAKADPAAARALLPAVVAGYEGLGATRRLADARALAAAADATRPAPAAAEAEAEPVAAEAEAGPVAADRPTSGQGSASGGVPALPPSAGLVLHAFGAFDVRAEGRLVDAWPRRKAKVLLAALVLRPGTVPSLELAELLGDGDPTSGLGILKVAARALRKALEPTLAPNAASAYVRTAADGYALAWDAVAACDLRDFTHAMDEAEAARDAAPDAAEAAYARALAWYRGDLFDEPGLREAFEAERAGLRARAIAACAWLAGRADARGDLAGAEAARRRAIAIDPCDEPGWIALIGHLRAAGRDDRARQAYWDARGELKRRLGAEPGEALEAAARPVRGA